MEQVRIIQNVFKRYFRFILVMEALVVNYLEYNGTIVRFVKVAFHILHMYTTMFCDSLFVCVYVSMCTIYNLQKKKYV